MEARIERSGRVGVHATVAEVEGCARDLIQATAPRDAEAKALEMEACVVLFPKL